MKFTDKFVLVPFDRYQRLMKETSFNKEETIKSKEVLQQEGKGFKTKETPSKQLHDIKTKKLKERDDSFNKSKSKTHSINGESLPIKKKSTSSKYPLPPPGIPNKPKEFDFKWIRVFK